MRIYEVNGRYWTSWTENGVTKKRSCRTKNRKVAERLAAKWELERADPDYAAKEAASLKTEAGLFLRELESRKVPDGTLDMYECKVGHLVRLLPPQLSKITVATVEDYFQTRKAEGASTSTLYKEWIGLRQIILRATKRGLFSTHVDVLKPLWVSSDYTPKTTHLTLDQVHALCAHLDPERAAAVAFVVATGARRGELFRARPEDYNPTDRTIQIRGSKTEGAWRRIPVPPPFQGLLEQALPHLPVQEWTNARRDLASAAERAGVPAVTWNDLRRTFGSILVQGGVRNDVVAKLMGHTTSAMVDRVYGQQTSASLAVLIETQWTRTGTRGSQ
jgi:integrase